MDLTAAIGLSQFKRLDKMMRIRSENRKKIINRLKNSNLWSDQYSFFYPSKNVTPSWFGLPIILNNLNKEKKEKFMNYLNSNGVETRPILSGNFLNQPSAKLYKLNSKNFKFNNSQKIEDTGFFIGLPTEKITDKNLNHLASKLMDIDKFQ